MFDHSVEGRSLQSRIFCALMGRPWFLRGIYPAFSARYMRAQTDADRRARAHAIAAVNSPDGARAVSELWRSFAAPNHDLSAAARRRGVTLTTPLRQSARCCLQSAVRRTRRRPHR